MRIERKEMLKMRYKFLGWVNGSVVLGNTVQRPDLGKNMMSPISHKCLRCSRKSRSRCLARN